VKTTEWISSSKLLKLEIITATNSHVLSYFCHQEYVSKTAKLK